MTSPQPLLRPPPGESFSRRSSCRCSYSRSSAPAESIVSSVEKILSEDVSLVVPHSSEFRASCDTDTLNVLFVHMRTGTGNELQGASSSLASHCAVSA